MWQQFPTTAEILGSATVTTSDPKSDEDWTSLRAVRDEVLKALEAARNTKLIGTGLEAQVVITASDPVYSAAAAYSAQLRYLFIVSASPSCRVQEMVRADCISKSRRLTERSATAVGITRPMLAKIKSIPQSANAAAQS